MLQSACLILSIIASVYANAILHMQAEHLQHWGINMVGMQKTEKTMTELQIDLNMSFEFDRITEKGAQLHPVSGPG